MKATLLSILIYAVISPFLTAETLSQLQENFESRLEQIELEQRLAWAPVARSYRDALERLFDTAREEANLDELTAVRDEQRRFAESTAAPDSFSDFPRLRHLQSRLLEQAREQERRQAERIVAAARELDQAMDTLQRRLVTEGKIEEALAVREARQALPQHEAVATALVRMRAQPVETGSLTRRPAVPPEAKAFLGRRFMLVREELRWEDARARAEEMGGRLAVIDSARVNEFLQKEIMIQDGPPWVWIGARRENGEAPWQWVNGEPIRYTNWGANQPSGRAREDFLSFTRDGTWNNLRGRRDTWFIIEWGP